MFHDEGCWGRREEATTAREEKTRVKACKDHWRSCTAPKWKDHPCSRIRRRPVQVLVYPRIPGRLAARRLLEQRGVEEPSKRKRERYIIYRGTRVPTGLAKCAAFHVRIHKVHVVRYNATPCLIVPCMPLLLYSQPARPFFIDTIEDADLSHRYRWPL